MKCVLYWVFFRKMLYLVSFNLNIDILRYQCATFVLLRTYTKINLTFFVILANHVTVKFFHGYFSTKTVNDFLKKRPFHDAK